MMTAETGRELWGEIHEFADFSKSNLDQEIFFALWFAKVEKTIGCASCFKKLQMFIRLWPVEFGGNFHLWALCLHDYVNKELGKKLYFPELTLAPLTNRGIIH